MKNTFSNTCVGFLSCLSFSLLSVRALAQDSVKSPLLITLSYFSINNQEQYLMVTAKSKAAGRIAPVKNEVVKLFLGKDSAGNGITLINQVTTDEKGIATTVKLIIL